MSDTTVWQPVAGSVSEILSTYPNPLMELASGSVPAFVFPQAYNPDHCSALIRRFYEQGHLYDPRTAGTDERTPRVDIGTSFGKHRKNPEAFFKHSADTISLYASLFDGYDNPVDFMYDTLNAITPGKRVMIAREPDGRLYGPAIFRTYYEKVGHTPHFDSVRKRTKAFEYAISEFDRQFAGVLCFQNASQDGDHGQAFLYRKQWSEEIHQHLPDFRRYATEHDIDRIRIDLDPGDFYIFCSETIHEVPPPRGDTPRIVLAVFFAMSDDRDEIFVWS